MVTLIIQSSHAVFLNLLSFQVVVERLGHNKKMTLFQDHKERKQLQPCNFDFSV